MMNSKQLEQRMPEIMEAKVLLESATPENPVKLKISNGMGQYVDVLVSDATVDIEFSYTKEEV